MRWGLLIFVVILTACSDKNEQLSDDFVAKLAQSLDINCKVEKSLSLNGDQQPSQVIEGAVLLDNFQNIISVIAADKANKNLYKSSKEGNTTRWTLKPKYEDDSRLKFQEITLDSLGNILAMTTHIAKDHELFQYDWKLQFTKANSCFEGSIASSKVTKVTGVKMNTLIQYRTVD